MPRSRHRTPLVAGNWKMHLTVAGGVRLATELRSSLEPLTERIELVVLPPAVMLYEVAGALRGSRIAVGAQNAYWEDAGAFTGEISASMLTGWCRVLLVGHSERRHIFHESDEDTRRKLDAGLRHHLHVILAIGETLEENEARRTDEVITRQLRVALQEVEGNLAARVSLAYEPVWAIGTGRAATPEYANDIMGRARQWLAAERSPAEASAMRILYGGSVTPANALSLMEQPEIDGALVGGASLKADQFTAIAGASATVATRSTA